MPRKTILSTCLMAASMMLAGAPMLAQEVTVRVGSAPSIASGALLIAVERGYFREVGIRVVIDPLDTAANAIALLAQNQFQIIEGGIAAGYFNALERNLLDLSHIEAAAQRLPPFLVENAESRLAGCR